MPAAQSADPEILPPGGVPIEVHEIEAIPPYKAELGDDDKPVLLTSSQIIAELREGTGMGAALNGQGPDAVIAMPFPRILCRFDSYSVVHHGWFKDFSFWCYLQVKSMGLSYRAENWDCDDYSQAYNAIADVAQLRARVAMPPRLIGRLVVRQEVTWAGVHATGLHELIIFRSGKGWWVCEPQNSTMIQLVKYPNRGNIREILFN